jgi:periplasmic divalent cation tolerance protein
MDDQLVVILTTLPAAHDAAVLARTLVDEHLAACVNVLPPMRSTYRWEGAVHQEPEQQLIIKTTRARVAGLQDRLAALHPYDVPEFLVLAVSDASRAYGSWLRESVDAR